ncbi:MAG: NAD(P)H-dependent oxidoreductase subunit E [Actinobacteria bacterium]|nr:NAD(P)H-dependent oxidoreductase subunit E [Actinomycetota bacterium]
MATLRARLQEIKREPGSTLEALYATQELFSYVPPEAITMIAEELGMPESAVYGVVTFYTMFYLEPQPRYLLRVCRDLSCHLAGAPEIVRAVRQELGTPRGEATADGLFKLEVVSCLGLCDKQPAMLVNLEQRGPMTPERIRALVHELRARGA